MDEQLKKAIENFDKNVAEGKIKIDKRINQCITPSSDYFTISFRKVVL